MWARRLLAVAAIAAGSYGLVVGTMFSQQRSMFYFPTGDIPTPGAAGVPEMTEVRLATTDGLVLRAWWRPPGMGQPTLVHFHGNAGNIGHRARRMRPFLDLGLGVLQVEYRGYGGNPGMPTEAGLYADGRAALAFLADAGIPPETWVIHGESLGTGVAVLLAFEQATATPSRPVRAVILEAPFDSLVKVAEAKFPWLPVNWLLKDRYESVERIGAIRTPLLIVQGDADDVIPITHGRRLFEAAAEPKRAVWLVGAGHNDVFESGGAEAVLSFLRSS
ncbi:MAG: alpha/beta hydrolase [Alphaproteobacteria bacterium]